MADYFPVLSRAVAGLENNTGEARRAVYERARAAIVRQLRAIEPPLAEEDIARERMNLEEAIRKVEAGAGGQPAASPAPSTPAKPEPPKLASPARPNPTARPAPPSGAGAERGAPIVEPEQAARRPATRPDGRPIIRTAGERADTRPRQRSGPLIALAALALIAVAAGLFVARGQIATLFGGDAQVAKTEPSAPATSPAAEPAAQPGEATPPEDAKSDERLPQDGGGPSSPPPAQEPPAQDAQTQQPAEQVARAPDTQTPEPAQPAPAAQAPLVAQRATLYEEGANQQSGDAMTGTVTWRTESVSGGQNQPLETALRGEIEIPGRNVKATLVIRRNADATLPASHTIELQFTLPEDFPNAGIANVPGILMKADESARGAAMAGLSVRVTNGFFLIGLSNLETERTVNEQLLRDRGWLDIPILYDNGRRAVLTLEKGTPGAQAFNDAFAAWQTAAPATPPQP
jgi:hypothetical protein